MEQPKLLEVINLTLKTPAQSKVVDSVSLTLHQGERVGLIGPSGSGKSLTAAAILDLLPPDISKTEGTITWHGATGPRELTPITIREYRGNHIALIFQEPTSALNPTHRVGRQVAEAVRNLQPTLTADLVAVRTDELLQEVQLADELVRIKQAYPHELSGGQRQRILIAIALAGDPDLLIADEPTTALDPRTEKDLLDLMDNLVKQRGLALLLITHDLALVKERTDRTIQLAAGKVVEVSAPEKPAEPGGVRGQTNSRGSATEVLSVQEITFIYPQNKRWFQTSPEAIPVLNELDLSLYAGEWVALIGPSGVGKTTLAKLITGRLSSDVGSISFSGKPPQLIPQDPFTSLNPQHRVARILREVLRVHRPKISRLEQREECVQLLAQVQLDADLLERYPSELSGGQKQRVAIARALAADCKVLIADESVSALDQSTRVEILALYRSLLQERGLSLLFITHDLTICKSYADRTLELQGGRLVQVEI